MSVGEIAGLVAAIAFVVLVALTAVPLLKLGRVLEEIRLAVRDIGHESVPILTELTGAEARDAQAATNNWTRQAGSAPFQWVTRATWERLYQWTMLQLGAQKITNPQLITRDGKPVPVTTPA